CNGDYVGVMITARIYPHTASPLAADTSITRRILSFSNYDTSPLSKCSLHPFAGSDLVLLEISRFYLLGCCCCWWCWWFPSEDQYATDYSQDCSDDEAPGAEEA